MKGLVILVLAIMLFGFSPMARADKYYGYYRYDDENPVTKLATGISEVATSWAEIPLSMIHYSEKYDPITGILIGIPVGSALAVKDCVEGTLNATFFFAPPYDIGDSGFLHLIDKIDDKIKENLW